ncbi:hypothetical protein GPJ56_003268 [Histomonas meleagridis]|uniref:uncharacterized protein n=1 Tax=Histomonas meleagridis TaxID=135588 RepID=UPI0035599BD2|nr:hypothetical protein GPJ56_003268 [Histomonas meleagridis]KAH0805929.1 hypothetical protein GO595_001260 [Histomonas meleagridis]
MAASGRTDDLEILYSHIDLLTSKLEIFHSMTAPGTTIGNAFESSSGKTWVKFLDSYCDAYTTNPAGVPKPPSGSSIQTFLKSIQNDLVVPMQLIKYAYQFCTFTEHQLKLMLSYVKDLDMRWNQYLTVRCCQIFVQFCKTVVFIKAHPIIKYITATINTQTNVKQFEQFKSDMQKTTQFMILCSQDPFKFIHDRMPLLSGKMARLSSAVGTFIARLFGTFPLIDWDSLSIFSRPSSSPESTLVSDEYIILQHISLLKEVLFFFLFAFPENTKSNQCFELIVEAVITESPYVYITRTFKMPLQQFVSLSKQNIIPSRVIDNASENARQKFTTSHIQRMMHVTFLLQDCLNIASFDPNQLPFIMNHVIALSSLAYYELDIYFANAEEEKNKDDIQTEGMELLCVLMEVIDLIDRYEEDLRRFYVFNLATIDLQFLQKQLNPSIFSQIGKSKEHDLAKLIDDLALGLEGIDLEDYDKGIRYEFTGFLLTHGRYLRIFNDIKTRERVSFIDPIFEHLTTIRMHCMFAQSPINTFLNYCPLQTLWNHSGVFLTIVKSPKIPLSLGPSLLHLFTFFSRDLLCLRQLLLEVRRLNELFAKLRSQLYQRLNDFLCSRFNSNSSAIYIGLQTHDYSNNENTTSKLKSLAIHGGMSRNLAEKQTLSLFEVNQVKQFCSRIPQHVVLFDKIDRTADYFSNCITKNLASFLFPLEAPDPSSLDMSFSAATQHLWTFFASLGSSFPRQMFQCRILESFSQEDSHLFNEQVRYLDGTNKFIMPKENKNQSTLEAKNQHLITKLEQKLGTFLKEGWEHSLYLPTLHGFWNNNPDVNNDISLFFSQKAFYYMIHNLGLHGGYRLDRILTHRSAKAMMKIFKVFTDMKNIEQLLDDFNKRDALPQDMPTNKGGIETSCKELLILGICLQLRSLLREEMSKASNESSPGIKNIIDASVYRIKQFQSAEQALICEMISGDTNDLTFIEEIICKNNYNPLRNVNQFFFFLGLNFISKRWDRCKYISNYDTITGNMHLLPLATKALIHELQLFFEPTVLTTQNIHNGYLLFFSVMAQIVTMRKNKKLNDSARAMTILADMYPRVMKMEYAIVEDSFPTRSVNYAYSQLNADGTS